MSFSCPQTVSTKSLSFNATNAVEINTGQIRNTKYLKAISIIFSITSISTGIAFLATKIDIFDAISLTAAVISTITIFSITYIENKNNKFQKSKIEQLEQKNANYIEQSVEDKSTINLQEINKARDLYDTDTTITCLKYRNNELHIQTKQLKEQHDNLKRRLQSENLINQNQSKELDKLKKENTKKSSDHKQKIKELNYRINHEQVNTINQLSNKIIALNDGNKKHIDNIKELKTTNKQNSELTKRKILLLEKSNESKDLELLQLKVEIKELNSADEARDRINHQQVTKIDQLSNKIIALNDGNKKHIDNIKELKTTNKQNSDSIKQKDDKISSLKLDNDNNKRKLSQLKVTLDSQLKQITEFTKKYKKSEQSIIKQDKEIESLKNTKLLYDETKDELSQLKISYKKLEEEMEDLDIDINVIDDLKDGEKPKLRKEIEEHKNNILLLKMEINELNNKIEELSSQSFAKESLNTSKRKHKKTKSFAKGDLNTTKRKHKKTTRRSSDAQLSHLMFDHKIRDSKGKIISKDVVSDENNRIQSFKSEKINVIMSKTIEDVFNEAELDDLHEMETNNKPDTLSSDSHSSSSPSITNPLI